jgi:hypothetical protein
MKKALIGIMLLVAVILQLTSIAIIMAALTLGTSQTSIVLDDGTVIIDGVVQEFRNPDDMTDEELIVYLKQWDIKPEDPSLIKRALLLVFQDTKYAPGYKEDEFIKIHVGMDENKVYELIGKPLSSFTVQENKEATGTKYLYYSESPSSTHYNRRAVVISREGKVLGKESYFYTD